MKKYVFFGILSLFVISCNNKNSREQQQPEALSVGIIEVPSRNVTGQTTYPVSIEGIINNEVRAKISGYITNVYVDEGDYVRKGQPLFKLETQTLTENAAAAQAEIDAAQVGVDQLKPLVEQNIVSEIQMKTAKAKLAQAKAAYQAITANIGYSRINSPINGYVGTINYRQGSLVDPSSPMAMTTISETSQVWGYFTMNEGDYINFLQMTPGKTVKEKMTHFPKVKLRLANGEIYAHEGTIQTVNSQIDPSTGTVSFRATFPNPEHIISNGSSGTVLVPKEYTDMVVVPAISTYEQQGDTYVYQLLQDSTVTPVIIHEADRVGDLVIVKSGITPGTRIVAKDAGKLRDKMKVVPVAESFDSVAAPIVPVFQ